MKTNKKNEIEEEKMELLRQLKERQKHLKMIEIRQVLQKKMR
jgi:hypothetical protein